MYDDGAALSTQAVFFELGETSVHGFITIVGSLVGAAAVPVP